LTEKAEKISKQIEDGREKRRSKDDRRETALSTICSLSLFMYHFIVEGEGEGENEFFSESACSDQFGSQGTSLGLDFSVCFLLFSYEPYFIHILIIRIFFIGFA
jgi:hypothetical protein